jgi:hypothetical protein
VNQLARITPRPFAAKECRTMNAVNAIVRDAAEAKALAAVAAADKWLDAARPIILAYFKLDDIQSELNTAHGLAYRNPSYEQRIVREAGGYVAKAREELFGMLEGVRDDFVADQMLPQPAHDVPYSDPEWEARDAFSDHVNDETLSVKDAIKRIEREWNEAFSRGERL